MKVPSTAPRGMKRVRIDGQVKLERDKAEEAKLSKVREWRASGLSYQAILNRCVDEGIKSRSGKSPSYSTVAQWVKAVEVPSHLKPRRGPNIDPSMRDSINHFMSLGLTKTEIQKRLDRSGVRNGNGNPYDLGQICSLVKRIERDIRAREAS